MSEKVQQEKCPIKEKLLDKIAFGPNTEYADEWYELSDATQEKIAESDEAIKPYITNQKEIDAHEKDMQEKLSAHLRMCQNETCKKSLRARTEGGIQ